MNPSAWIFLILAGILVLGLVEAGRSMFAAPVPAAEPAQAAAFDPAFKVGDPAPDFTLPDSTGKAHRLSELVTGDTMLIFACGCAQCMDLESYLGMLRRKMGKQAPAVISVSTMPRESEESWLAKTRLAHKILYEEKQGPVMEEYRGHPCPRVFRLSGDRRVTWMSPSPKDVPELRILGTLMATELGFPNGLPPGEGAP